MQIQAKLCESLAQIGHELLSLLAMLESHHEIVGVSYDGNVASR